MAALPTTTSVLNAEHASFFQSGVAINLATRDHGDILRVARAICCRVLPDRRRLTLIAAKRAIDRFIGPLKGTQAIAAVFCLPSTHRAPQTHGFDAVIEPTRETDRALAEQAIAAFRADLVLLGYDEACARVETAHRPDELVAVTFTPGPVFEQTPGPKAGTRL